MLQTIDFKQLNTNENPSIISYVPARMEAQCSVLPVEATQNLLLTPGAVDAVVGETFVVLSIPGALFLLLHVVSALRHSDRKSEIIQCKRKEQSSQQFEETDGLREAPWIV